MTSGDPPSSRRPAAPSDPVEEKLYDAYVEALLDGTATPPESFLAEHDEVGESFRACLAQLWATRGGAEAAPDSDLPYTRLGEYRILGRLGEGGMGAVYLGEQESLGRLAALKVLRPESRGSATAAARFEREAQVVARLRHPNLVTVFGVGEEEGVRFLAMEHVPGEGLDEAISSAAEDGTPLPVATVVRWGAQLAGALHAVHEAGVVHRDVKPSNIRITPEGRPILLDFGVALDDDPVRLTADASFLGTMLYAAPEQVAGDAGGPASIDARTDVYSLGVTLYEAITGRAPFDAGTARQVLHRMLTEDARPARQVRSGVPRDLEIVLQKAMEKDPARRYVTAAEFADDLDAVLRFQPIRARPAGPVDRLWKWARRRPAVASAAAVVVLAAVVFSAVEVWQRRAETQQREHDAVALVEQARARIDLYVAAHEGVGRELNRVRNLQHDLSGRHLSDEEHRELQRLERRAAGAGRDIEAAYHEVLELLRRAEQLDAGVAGADRVRAELFHVRWREATASGDSDAARFFAERVREFDAEGTIAARMGGTGTVVLTADADAAEAFVFRYVDLDRAVEDGEPRRVPVGLDADGSTPGRWALRIVGRHGPLEPGDLVVGVDGTPVDSGSWAAQLERAVGGGVAVRVQRGGRVLELDVPAGATLRPTAAAVAVPDAALARAVDGRPWTLDEGEYLVVVRAPGREDVRLFVRIAPVAEPTERSLRLPPEGTTPPGFVYLPAHRRWTGRDAWMMEREVTAGEYLEFVNDPPTLAAIRAADGPIRFPRNADTASTGGHWPRAEDGRYRLPEDWPSDWPAIGVSFDDARAYAAWYTARTGGALVYGLPTYGEWKLAGHGGSPRRVYTWGLRFHPGWTSSCYSQPQANVEPVMSYPIDESWCGVYDMCGSAFEWVDDWFDEARGLRRLAGGSWGRTQPELFRVEGGIGSPPEGTGDEYGFRLAAHRAKDAR